MSNCETMVGFQETRIHLSQDDREIINITRVDVDHQIGSERKWYGENPFEKLNNQVTDFVKSELGQQYQEIIVNNFWEVLVKKERKVNSAQKCLAGAKVSALMAMINQKDLKTAVNLGLQSIDYLKNLGLSYYLAEKIEKEFYQSLMTENEKVDLV
ncbi:MAG: hypothetical protein PHE32_03920 [Candidatus Shapirobacteria bacterium]|nr:hypothetical protein [Candidatus Shapirobacteria bacterium]MDD4410823.1 hypothetical protein [Candidatus Shapirobacteria bacterium]